MKASSLLGHSAQLLRIIRKSPNPADLLTSNYTRERKYLGAADRRALSAVVFLSLRMLPTTERVVEALPIPAKEDSPLLEELSLVVATLMIASLLRLNQPLRTLGLSENTDSHASELKSYCISLLVEKNVLSAESAAAYCEAVSATFLRLGSAEGYEGLSIRSCLPRWIVERWLTVEKRDPHDIEQRGLSLLQPAPLCIRVNPNVISRAEVVRRLREHSISCDESVISPHGITIHERVQITQTELFKSGAIDVQDEGSQLVAFALDPSPGWRILDACAGAGGKTLHCAVVQHDKGYILASDAEAKRMRELHSRMHKAQLRSIHIQTLHTLSEAERAKLYASFDAVLIDAPCTGMGTVRRSPMLKHRLTAQGVDAMSARQREIVHEYSAYVRHGGVLVYVTCSLMREENEAVAEWFIDNHTEFEFDPILPHISKVGCQVGGISSDDAMLNLTPDRHGCDGFFIARFIRKS